MEPDHGLKQPPQTAVPESTHASTTTPTNTMLGTYMGAL